jgi:hypothetical protein
VIFEAKKLCLGTFSEKKFYGKKNKKEGLGKIIGHSSAEKKKGRRAWREGADCSPDRSRGMFTYTL